MSKHIHIVEVGPRDGLQNEKQTIPTEIKLQFIRALCEAGLKTVEATSFVSPKWVPQMADHADIAAELPDNKVRFPVLIPNLRGLQRAIDCGIEDIAVFTATSNTFTQKNTNCSVKESLERIEDICELAIKNQMNVRAYISTVIACPYEGEQHPEEAASLAKKLLELGCYEISLGDTIGVGTPNKIKRLIEHVAKVADIKQLALHCHDTYGQAIANIYAGIEMGVTTFDSAAGGLGGCPYAPGAGGNVATEDVVYLMQGLGMETGIDLQKLIQASQIILDKLNIPTRSKVARTFL